MVLSAGGESYSLIVDAMADVVDIPLSAIEKPTGGEGGQRECIDGVYPARGGLVHLLSIEAILAGLGDTAAERNVR